MTTRRGNASFYIFHHSHRGSPPIIYTVSLGVNISQTRSTVKGQQAKIITTRGCYCGILLSYEWNAAFSFEHITKRKEANIIVGLEFQNNMALLGWKYFVPSIICKLMWCENSKRFGIVGEMSKHSILHSRKHPKSEAACNDEEEEEQHQRVPALSIDEQPYPR